MNFTGPALELLEQLEGCRLQAYQDEGGMWTIGYGHTGRDVQPGAAITKDQADEFLRDDLGRFISGAHEALAITLNDNQFSALVILAYNIGIDALLHSRLLGFINAGLIPQALAAWYQWCHVRGVASSGLMHRRVKEVLLFNQPTEVTGNA